MGRPRPDPVSTPRPQLPEHPFPQVRPGAKLADLLAGTDTLPRRGAPAPSGLIALTCNEIRGLLTTFVTEPRVRGDGRVREAGPAVCREFRTVARRRRWLARRRRCKRSS